MLAAYTVPEEVPQSLATLRRRRRYPLVDPPAPPCARFTLSSGDLCLIMNYFSNIRLQAIVPMHRTVERAIELEPILFLTLFLCRIIVYFLL